MKKLKSNAGESLIETLAALLIITLTVVFLVNSVTKASDLKKKADKYDKEFSYAAAPSYTVSVYIGDSKNPVEAQGYVCENENEKYSYYYYEP